MCTPCTLHFKPCTCEISSSSAMLCRLDLDKILDAPTVPHLRYGCAVTVQDSSGAPLHHGKHRTNMKTPKYEGAQVRYLRHLRIFVDAPLPCFAFWLIGPLFTNPLPTSLEKGRITQIITTIIITIITLLL